MKIPVLLSKIHSHVDFAYKKSYKSVTQAPIIIHCSLPFIQYSMRYNLVLFTYITFLIYSPIIQMENLNLNSDNSATAKRPNLTQA